MVKPTYRIENWLLTGLPGQRFLFGINPEERPGIPAGEFSTSVLTAFDPDNNHAETLNTIYILGTPAVPDFDYEDLEL